MKNTIVRTPTAAGQFYPKQASELTRQLEFFLSKIEEQEEKSQVKFSKKADIKNIPPKILIVPHAGYQYSGPVLGAGFAQLINSPIKTVFLLGNSHLEFLSKACLSGVTAWETPLGQIKVNQEIVKQLIAKPGWKIDNEAHQHEHSLEVLLPFLQYVLRKSSPDFNIVPILISSFDFNYLETLADHLAQLFTDQTLLIISSDLSHYPSGELATQVDQELIQAIVEQDLEKFKSFVVQTSPEENLQTRACAGESIKVGMILAQLLKCKQAQLYHYQHSGHASQNFAKVVGYASIGFY